MRPKINPTQNIFATALQSPGRCFSIIEVSFSLTFASGNVQHFFLNDFTVFTITGVSFILTETVVTVFGWKKKQERYDHRTGKNTLYVLELATTGTSKTIRISWKRSIFFVTHFRK